MLSVKSTKIQMGLFAPGMNFYMISSHTEWLRNYFFILICLIFPESESQWNSGSIHDLLLKLLCIVKCLLNKTGTALCVPHLLYSGQLG